jgi:hypothetical protein
MKPVKMNVPERSGISRSEAKKIIAAISSSRRRRIQ